MRKQYQKSLLSLAVGAALVSTSAMAIDGYDYSGSTARSQALQMNYFSHVDVGNIWVNPALAARYQGQVMANVNAGNNGGNGSGGILMGSGANTFGIYIGRDSVADFDIDGESPESQFDLFYARDMGNMAIGGRLNYQNNEQDDSWATNEANISGEAPLFAGEDTDITFGSIDAALAHFRANREAFFANDAAQPTAAELVYTGDGATLNESNVWNVEASEINLSLGFELKSLGIDGALLLGSASGSGVDGWRDSGSEYTLENDGSDKQVVRRTVDWSEGETTTQELDSGSTMALALRAGLMKSDNATLTGSLLYATQDYSVNFNRTVTVDATEYSDDTANEQLGRYAERYQVSGKDTDETDMMAFYLAYEMRPATSTTVTVAGGLEMMEGTFARSRRIVQNTTTIYADQDGAFGMDAGQFATIYGEIGDLSNDQMKMEQTNIPFNLAMEHGLNDRWTARASISRLLYSNTKWSGSDTWGAAEVVLADTIDAPAATDADQSTESGSNVRVRPLSDRWNGSATWVNQPTILQVGTGYTLDKLTIDTLIGKEFFTQGTDNGLFGAVSVTYKF